MTKTKTGIPGFDSLVDGGFVKGNTVLVSGPSGSGKTIFGLQFLYTGVSKYDEPGVLVTLDARPPELCAEAKQFGWDLEKLVAEGTIMHARGGWTPSRSPGRTHSRGGRRARHLAIGGLPGAGRG